MQKKHTVRLLAAVAAIAFVFGATGAWAGGLFTDVPPAHPFADEIEAMASAGITTGFPDGAFRPGEGVSRQAMAAFLGRGLGRSSFSQQISQVGTAPMTMASLTMASGATGGGGGYVLFDVSLTMNEATADADCPCSVDYSLRDVTNGVNLVNRNSTISSLEDESGSAWANGSLTWRVPLPADTTRTYAVVVAVQDDDFGPGDNTVAASVFLGATYVPFGNDGTGSAFEAPAEAPGDGVDG